MKKLFYLFSFLLLSGYAFSQNEIRCRQKVTPPTNESALADQIFERRLRQFLHTNMRMEAMVYTIPVVVHVVYSTENPVVTPQRVQSQIDALNRDYSRTNSDSGNAPPVFRKIAASPDIRFHLAVTDPNGNPTTGITYTKTKIKEFTDDDRVKYTATGGRDAWDPSQYLNIWVCTFSGSVLGYYPGDYVSTIGTTDDGVVIASRAFGTEGSGLSEKFNLGRTTTHEVGHWLGLYHPSGKPDSAGCTTDMVDDTPPQSTLTTGCPRFPYIDADCDNRPNGRNFSNFMDYADDACMNMFTKDQAVRMRTVLAVNRSSILNSNGLKSSLDKDLAVTLKFDSASFCNSGNTFPAVRIFNRGRDVVNELNIEFSVNNSTNFYRIPASLDPLEDTLVYITDVSLDEEGAQLKAVVTFPLPLSDENSSNNSDTFSYRCVNPLSIYPNPAAERLYIKGNSPEINSCTIHTLSGAQVMKVSNPSEIDVSGLAPGFYLIILETKEKVLRHQLIVVK